MTASKKKVDYIHNYNVLNYQEIRFRLKKDQTENAAAQAKINGYDSINAYAKALLEEALLKESGNENKS
ncbi:MAG: hypothetical protein K2P87_12975 [Lachnospiraceae bacterium]|nr:hypothetical protein [Lachnospiraceae bacterium]